MAHASLEVLLGPYPSIFPIILGGIALWLMWRRRQNIKDWPPLQPALDFSTATQLFLVSLFLSGWILLAALWSIDLDAWKFRIGSFDLSEVHWLQNDWLTSHAYIPNILAGATGFCIGAPFALVVLAGFTAQREEKSTLDRVNRLSATAWDSFRGLVDDFASGERYKLIVNHARDISTYYNETTAAVDAYIDSARFAFEEPEHITPENSNFDNHFECLVQIEANFRLAVNGVRQNINFFRTHDEWAQIVGSWRVLDQYVRLQRLEQDLDWFDAEPDSGLRKWMSRQGNPLQELLDAIEVRLYTANTTLTVDTMANALDTLSAYIRVDSPFSLAEIFLTEGNPFPMYYSAEYHKKVDAAQLFVLDLQRYIGLINYTSWPRSQTVPEATIADYRENEYQKAILEFKTRLNREKRKRRIRRVLWGISATSDLKQTPIQVAALEVLTHLEQEASWPADSSAAGPHSPVSAPA